MKTSIADVVQASWTEQRHAVESLLDQLEELIPRLDDELLVWLLTSIETAVDTRPIDRRNPWSALLAARHPRVAFHWQAMDWCRGFIEQRRGGHTITLAADLNRTTRRWVLAHELAHLALDNIERCDVGGNSTISVAERRIEEQRTDAHALALFDVSQSSFNPTR